MNEQLFHVFIKNETSMSFHTQSKPSSMILDGKHGSNYNFTLYTIRIL